jgi:hypothetical protein
LEGCGAATERSGAPESPVFCSLSAPFYGVIEEQKMRPSFLKNLKTQEKKPDYPLILFFVFDMFFIHG